MQSNSSVAVDAAKARRLLPRTLGATLNNRARDILRWAVPAALVVFAIAYSFYRRSETSYWDGAVGNWLATLLGIITGVPVALYLERNRAKSEQVEQQRVDRLIRRDVLTLLRAELIDAQAKIAQRTALGSSIPVEPLKTSAWEAMQATGSLRYVAELSLISVLSEAYRLVQILAGIEHTLHRTIYGINVQFPDGENAATKILRNAVAFHAPTLAALGQAIAVADSALASLQSS